MRIPLGTLRAMHHELGSETWLQHRDAIRSSAFFMKDPKGMNKALSDVFSAETVFIFYDPTQQEEVKRYVVIRDRSRLPWSAVYNLGSPVNYSITASRNGKDVRFTKPAVLVSANETDNVVCVDIYPRLVAENGSAQFYICNPQLALHIDSFEFREIDNLENLLTQDHDLHTLRKNVGVIPLNNRTTASRDYGIGEPTSL